MHTKKIIVNLKLKLVAVSWKILNFDKSWCKYKFFFLTKNLSGNKNGFWKTKVVLRMHKSVRANLFEHILMFKNVADSQNVKILSCIALLIITIAM